MYKLLLTIFLATSFSDFNILVNGNNTQTTITSTIKGFSSVKKDFADINFDYKSINKTDFSFITYLRSDNYNYFYFSSVKEINYNKQVELSYSLNYNYSEEKKEFEETLIKKNLSFVSRYFEEEIYYYKYALKDNDLSTAVKVHLNEITFLNETFKVDQLFNYEKENNLVSKKSKSILFEDTIKLTSGIAFEDVYTNTYYPDSFIKALKRAFQIPISEYDNLSYFVFNTSLDSIIDRITDLTISYDGINYKGYIQTSLFPEDYNIKKYSELEKLFIKYEESPVSQTISLKNNDEIDLTRTGFLGFKTIYKFPGLFSRTDIKDYPDLYNYMFDNAVNHGCLFKATKRVMDGPLEITTSTSDGGGGGSGGVRPAAATTNAYKLTGYKTNSVKALNIKYLKNGIPYFKTFEDNLTIGSDVQIVTKGPDGENKNYETILPEWLQAIVDFFKNFGLTILYVLGAVFIVFILIKIIPGIITFFQNRQIIKNTSKTTKPTKKRKKKKK